MSKNVQMLLLIIATLLPREGLFAQTLKDKIYVSYSLFPSTPFKEARGESHRATLTEVQIGPPPIQLHPKLKWINTVNGRVNQLNFSNLEETYASTSFKLYDLQYGSIFTYDLKNPHWSLFSSSNNLLRSDFNESISSKSFFFRELLMANYNPDGNDNLVWSFGVAFANDFNRNVLIPIVGLTYNDDRYTIEVAYPRINLSYKPRAKVEWGITASIQGGIYKTQITLLPTLERSEYTRTINAQVGHTFNYLLTNRVVLNTYAGYAFVQNYDLMNSDFENIKSVNLDLDGSFFLRTGEAVRL